MFNSSDVTTNVHYLNDDMEKKDEGSRCVSVCKMPNPTKRFVNYSVLWEPNKITFFIDSKKIRTLNDIPNVDTPMRVVFDLWGKQEYKFYVTQPMKCRNFKYEKL